LPGEAVDDPLTTGIELGDAGEVVRTVMEVVTRSGSLAPIVEAALVHAALAAGMPFTHANGAIARCAAASLLIARGTDPAGRLALNSAMAASGRPGYVQMLRRFSTLTPAAVDESVLWFCGMVADAASNSQRIVERVRQAISTA
jgi:hypothetical protein